MVFTIWYRSTNMVRIHPNGTRLSLNHSTVPEGCRTGRPSGRVMTEPPLSEEADPASTDSEHYYPRIAGVSYNFTFLPRSLIFPLSL